MKLNTLYQELQIKLAFTTQQLKPLIKFSKKKKEFKRDFSDIELRKKTNKWEYKERKFH